MTILLLVSVLWANAQSDELIIRGLTGNLYLEHTVAAKDTWYSVGRLFNVEPKSLARYNHRTFSHALEIGEELKVPLTAENFSQNGKKLASETMVPVYHVVQEKEWLYRISVNHNKVPIPVLEKWNHVTGDQVHAGLHLIVGYLKVKTALSALAKRKWGPAPGNEPAVAGNEPLATHDETLAAHNEPLAAHKGPPAGAKAVMPPASGAPATQRETTRPENGVTRKSDSEAIQYRESSRSGIVQTPAAPSSVSPRFDGGKFKEDYNDGGHSIAGEAGVFKSTSGWQDGKYYALINNVPVGTIVRIKDQSNGKSVYAKVLGQLPDMKESIGLTIRLSNAAAAELGEGDGRFAVGVSY